MDKELDLSSQCVCVTGGAGFLGTHLIEKLKAHGAKDIFVPTYPEYDLVREADILRMLTTPTGRDHPPGSQGGRHRCQP